MSNNLNEKQTLEYIDKYGNKLMDVMKDLLIELRDSKQSFHPNELLSLVTSISVSFMINTIKKVYIVSTPPSIAPSILMEGLVKSLTEIGHQLDKDILKVHSSNDEMRNHA